MEKLTFTIYTLLLLFASSSFGQQIDEKLSSWYWSERFNITDLNEDALLDKSEMGRFPAEYAFFIENFKGSDKNGDGLLSFNEMIAMKQAEIGYRTTMENRKLARLKEQFPELATPSYTLLRKKPELVAELFANFTWMIQNPQLVDALQNDKQWMASNPKVQSALKNNLCWMASAPKSAKHAYKNLNYSDQPELLGWRADHLKFLKINSISADYYLIDGYQAVIKLGTKF